MTLPLAAHVAVVTGGTGGLGSAVCRRLAENGATLVVGFRRNESAARALIDALPVASSSRHIAVQADVTQSTSIKRLVDEIAFHHQAVNILVNCAGTTSFVPHANLTALDDDLIDRIFATNWRGPFATIRALLPLLQSAQSGLVVNISSVAAVTGIGSNVAYCASKAALNAMTVSLARALAPAIRVVSVSPGVVETDFIKGLDESWQVEQLRRTPLARFASPDDVADAVLAVATTLRYSTGCVIPVDGGRAMG
jgi:3-oxoacyl-[acyl-carrier protein] reductase